MLLDQHWNTVPGGTARSVVGLVDALVEHGCDVVGVHGRYLRPPVLELPGSVAAQRLPFPGRLMTQMWSRSGNPSPDSWLRADVLHAPAYVMPNTSMPVVVTLHDLAFKRYPEWFSARGVAYLNRFVDRVRETNSSVIVPSEATASDCLSVGIEEERLHVIPWGIDIPDVSSQRIEQMRITYGLPERFVLFVGTLEPRKNLGALIDAIELLDDVPLVVVGPDGWGDTSAAGIRLPSLSRADLDAVMAAATVLVYPSHFEGFGLPVLEAMAVGTPVVTTAETAPAQILKDGGLAVDTQSPQAIAGAIEAIVADDALASRLGRSGKARAASFGWDVTARATQSVYEAIE